MKKLTAPQMNVLEALRNGAKIERRTKATKVLGQPCTVFTGRFLVATDGTATRINNHCDLLPALVIWDAEMKASNPDWRLVAHIATRKAGSDDVRERGAFIARLGELLERSAAFRKQDRARLSTLTVRFPNGMTLNIRNEAGDAFGC